MLIYWSQVTGHSVCVCVPVVGRWSRDGEGPGRRAAAGWQAWDARPSTAVQPLLPLCPNVLDRALQGPVTEGAVMWKPACTQCCAKSQGRCKLPAAFILLNQGRHDHPILQL